MMHRMRIGFSRENAIRYVSHLDMIRLWERALRRADVPLAYSQGFAPHPHLVFALPLSVGMTSEAELLDVYLNDALNPQMFRNRVETQLPEGLGLLQAEETPILLPPLPSQVRSVEYQVTARGEKPLDGIDQRVTDLLAAGSLPVRRAREGKIDRFDCRPLVQGLWLISTGPGECTLGMKLQIHQQKAVRPGEILEVLGLSECSLLIHRTRINLEQEAEAESVAPISPTS